jgi:predicted HAD superfamily Cof-like phosphohydrolase
MYSYKMFAQCKKCTAFFERFKCNKTHGECDCPKCQGYCECDMANSIFDDVGSFRRKMGLPISNNPHLLEPEESSYFTRFILEELSEYMRAVEEGSIVDAADAIVDMVYVALGCAHAMGLPFNDLFAVVHDANMRKVPASDAQRSVRGSTYDVVKPVGWCPPEGEMLAIIQTKQAKAK